MTAPTNVTDNSSVYAAINAANKSSAKSSTSDNQISETQDRFLKLLTTQLKNQDPLNPMDNAQMTSQMAQISTVDGITKLNATLQQLINNSADSQTMQAAALVGRNVLVPGSSIAMANGVGVGGFDLAAAADKVTVTIKNEDGLAVRTLQLGKADAGAQSFQWDGKTDNGTPAAGGKYSFSVEAGAGKETVTATALSVGQVGSVERGSGGLTLNVGNLGAFKLSDVHEIL